MAKPESNDSILITLMDNVARVIAYLGGAAFLVGVGFLGYYYSLFTGEAPQNAKQAIELVEMFTRIGTIGGIMGAIGFAIMFWGEEIAGPLLLIVSGIAYFGPMALGAPESELAQAALSGVRQCGGAAGIIAVFVTVIDAATRVRNRMVHGAKADTLKYGKGVKEDHDRQNVLLGKCWQLPYCRKYVRDLCPIFHAKRTCWKERVGCMCEEKVIQNAMAGKPISKDALTAAKFIPYNKSVPMEVKIQRCRQCVIYNEHQRHKYKVFLPLTMIAVFGSYFAFRPQIMTTLDSLIGGADKFLGKATLKEGSVMQGAGQLDVFREFLAIVLTLMLLAYLLKLLEHLVFKLKI